MQAYGRLNHNGGKQRFAASRSLCFSAAPVGIHSHPVLSHASNLTFLSGQDKLRPIYIHADSIRNGEVLSLNAVIVGNICSFFAACFTLASAWSRDRKRIYLYQAAQCFILAAANIFFASVSGTTTLFLCALRNCLIAYDRFTPRRCLIFVLSVAAVGLAANNRGLIGLIPVVTTAIYTVGCLYARSPRAIKLNLILNLILWAIYDMIILDLVSFAVDTISAVMGTLSLFRNSRMQKTGNASFK